MYANGPGVWLTDPRTKDVLGAMDAEALREARRLNGQKAQSENQVWSVKRNKHGDPTGIVNLVYIGTHETNQRKARS